jgi:hypothetical protein
MQEYFEQSPLTGDYHRQGFLYKIISFPVLIAGYLYRRKEARELANLVSFKV